MSFYFIHKTLYDDLGLSNKLTRWVPKLLNDEQKNERVRLSESLVAAVCRHSMAYMFIVHYHPFDKTMVSLHTPLTKKKSKS